LLCPEWLRKKKHPSGRENTSAGNKRGDKEEVGVIGKKNARSKHFLVEIRVSEKKGGCLIRREGEKKRAFSREGSTG